MIVAVRDTTDKALQPTILALLLRPPPRWRSRPKLSITNDHTTNKFVAHSYRARAARASNSTYVCVVSHISAVLHFISQ